jgi:hypothetical protein
MFTELDWTSCKTGITFSWWKENELSQNRLNFQKTKNISLKSLHCRQKHSMQTRGTPVNVFTLRTSSKESTIKRNLPINFRRHWIVICLQISILLFATKKGNYAWMVLVQWVTCTIKSLSPPPPFFILHCLVVARRNRQHNLSPPEDPSERRKQNKKYRSEGYGMNAMLMRVSKVSLFSVTSSWVR